MLWKVPRYNERSSSSRLSHMEAPKAAGLRRIYSCDLTDFSSTNWTLCAVKRTEECDESTGNLTRYRGKSPITTSAVLRRVYLRWKHLTPLDRGGFSGDLADCSSTSGTLCAVKRADECDESPGNLTRYRGKSPITTSEVFHRVYLTW